MRDDDDGVVSLEGQGLTSLSLCFANSAEVDRRKQASVDSVT